jgi:hypothetical protein
MILRALAPLASRPPLCAVSSVVSQLAKWRDARRPAKGRQRLLQTLVTAIPSPSTKWTGSERRTSRGGIRESLNQPKRSPAPWGREVHAENGV